MKKITSIVMTALMIVAVQATVFASDDNGYRSKFYGTIEELPAGLNGTWIVNGRSVEVTPQTRIEQKHGLIAVGTYVEIKGRSDGQSFTAHKVEVKRRASDSSHDGDDSRRYVTGKDELHSGIHRLPRAEPES